MTLGYEVPCDPEKEAAIRALLPQLSRVRSALIRMGRYPVAVVLPADLDPRLEEKDRLEQALVMRLPVIWAGDKPGVVVGL